MIVVIDGYNAIRFFEKAHGEKSIHDSVKQRFIARLELYAYARRTSIHEVVIVFDGGEFRWASKEKRRFVLLVHAGQGMSADDWIVHFCEGKKAHEYVLVTNDRVLGDRVQQAGVFNLNVESFFDCVAVALEKRHLVNRNNNNNPLVEYASDEDEFENSNNLYLRELMEGSTRAIMIKKEDQAEDCFRVTKRAEKTPTRSKKELRIRRIMEKL